jgi:hypothetical protein
MIYIEAPNNIETKAKKLFLAGAISGAPDWQRTLIEMIEDLGMDIAVYNPRRKDFKDNPRDAIEQIEWEFRALREADYISFWFCKETIAPIALFELGAWTATSKPLVVGIASGYELRLDVETQVRLARPDVPILYNLSDLASEIFNMTHEIKFT